MNKTPGKDMLKAFTSERSTVGVLCFGLLLVRLIAVLALWGRWLLGQSQLCRAERWYLELWDDIIDDDDNDNGCLPSWKIEAWMVEDGKHFEQLVSLIEDLFFISVQAGII